MEAVLQAICSTWDVRVSTAWRARWQPAWGSPTVVRRQPTSRAIESLVDTWRYSGDVKMDAFLDDMLIPNDIMIIEVSNIVRITFKIFIDVYWTRRIEYLSVRFVAMNLQPFYLIEFARNLVFWFYHPTQFYTGYIFKTNELQETQSFWR